MTKISLTELISQHHNKLLANFFGINTIREYISQKYYCFSFCNDIKAYIKSFNICLAVKKVKHKLYGNIQRFLLATHL